ncbi:MAG: hypothetical protein A2Z48_08185 [Actinobacteria bacterium RBG_19FT_COMBO_70_19]|nr:MAG: hypothetical protein A2Z48_08185 [Actinobacteria bacterium RBG_19FT_COMBO_70_19]
MQSDPARDLRSSPSGHPRIHEGDIRPFEVGQVNSLLRIRYRSDQLEGSLVQDQIHKGVAGERVVVGDEDAKPP